jgi:tRNA1Val (adenine37-N6)-methyltransferase
MTAADIIRLNPQLNSNVKVNPNERVDDLHRNGYMLIQDPERFCFGIDAVLLAGFAKMKPTEVALDMCTGTGVIPILMKGKTEGEQFVGVEIQPESAEMARRSVMLNYLENNIYIQEGDIKELDKMYRLGSFDVVTCNPPYMPNGGGLQNDYTPKAIARHELLCTLEDVLMMADKMLRVGGRMYMVHRPTRLAEIFATSVKYNLEPKRMRLVHPTVDREPSLVLIEFVKGGKPMIKVEPPLIIYLPNGEYTTEINEIYYK